MEDDEGLAGVYIDVRIGMEADTEADPNVPRDLGSTSATIRLLHCLKACENGQWVWLSVNVQQCMLRQPAGLAHSVIS